MAGIIYILVSFLIVIILIIVAIVIAVKKNKLKKLAIIEQEQMRIKQENEKIEFEKRKKESIIKELAKTNRTDVNIEDKNINLSELQKETIEIIIKENPLLKDGKIIHTYNLNAIVFTENGEIGIFNNEINGIKLLNIKDIKSMRYDIVKDSYVHNCVITTYDFNNPIIKLDINAWEKDDAKNIYNEIKTYYSILKNKK